MKNHFESLSLINVNDKVEKKNNLTYLSWAWAWAEVKKVYPSATYQVHMYDNLPYVYDERTGYMVFTSVTIDGVQHTMWLPVMDGANRAMFSSPRKYNATAWVAGKKQEVEKTIEAATMFDINKTIMRCLTKNLAMFGLGLYIYAGEDLPEPEQAPQVAKEKKPEPAAAEKLEELKVGDANWDKVVLYIEGNKSKGAEAIIAQVERKFTVKPAVKKAIEKEVSK
jgi:hypothetical protein